MTSMRQDKEPTIFPKSSLQCFSLLNKATTVQEKNLHSQQKKDLIFLNSKGILNVKSMLRESPLSRRTTMQHKKYLLTWYGITDLRSAMGFDIQGPVLGALKTGCYDNAIILAYSKKKEWSPGELTEQEKAVADLAGYTGNKLTAAREDSLRFIDTLANTRTGHIFYQKWLTSQLTMLNTEVSLIIKECFLQELNDTSGIYFSAVGALQQAIDNGAMSITAYLSPGTPVMAFSWALALLAFPRVQVKLVASPDFRQGVKEISIPPEVLNHIASGYSRGS